MINKIEREGGGTQYLQEFIVHFSTFWQLMELGRGIIWFLKNIIEF